MTAPSGLGVLSERRKDDRALMAGHVAGLARMHGLSARIHPEKRGTRRTAVDLAGSHGLSVTVAFDGNSPHRLDGGWDTYVLSWHGVEEGWRLHPDRFRSVNSYHGHKATDVVHGFTALQDLLRWRFATIADGSAFVSDS
jgi:hypothetical protein